MNLRSDIPQLNEYQWTQMEEMRDLVKVSYDLALDFLKADLTAGMFYAKWTNALAELERNASPIAQGIVDSMERRRRDIMIPTLLAAVRLDPASADILTDEDKSQAELQILRILTRVRKVEDPHETNEEDTFDEDDDISKARKRRRMEIAATVPASSRPMSYSDLKVFITTIRKKDSL